MKRSTSSARTAPSKRRARRVGQRARSRASNASARTGPIEVHEIESLRGELERLSRSTHPPRWNADPDDVRRSVAKLVLTLVDFIRQLLERQAIRRLDAGTLTAAEIESIGTALMRLEETVRDLCAQFDLSPEDLNIDLGPVGKLV
jgi:hypothetical protein